MIVVSICYVALKQKLSRIPDQIHDRSEFLQTIRLIFINTILTPDSCPCLLNKTVVWV